MTAQGQEQTLDVPNGNVRFTAQNGATHEAPGNSVTRMKNMMAACEAIAERWPAIKPPKGAVL